MGIDMGDFIKYYNCFRYNSFNSSFIMVTRTMGYCTKIKSYTSIRKKENYIKIVNKKQKKINNITIIKLYIKNKYRMK